MPFLEWIAAKLTGEAIKGGAEFAKTATEIPKNIVETRKAELEVAELKVRAQERERLIVPATFDDVKQFDPMYGRIHDMAPAPCALSSQARNSSGLLTVVLIVILGIPMSLLLRGLVQRGLGLWDALPMWPYFVLVYGVMLAIFFLWRMRRRRKSL